MARYGGIDLGGTKIQAVVTDDEHAVLGSARHPTPTTGGPADVALAMIGALREAADAAGVAPGGLTAVGVGSPGVVDDEAGTVTSARNLPGWEGTYALADKLESLGKDAELIVHPGVDHAFFNDTRPEVYDAATAGLCWQLTVGFLKTNLV